MTLDAVSVVQIIRHTQYIQKQKRAQCSKRGATGSSQRANAPLMGYPVTKTIRTESSATHEIKNYYKDTQGTYKHDTNQKHAHFIFTPSIV